MTGKHAFLRKFTIAIGVLGCAGLGGGYYAYQQRLQNNRRITAEEFNAKQNQTELRNALQHLTDPVNHPNTKFFRYTTCPWCGTVKAFLDYNKIDHTCVEVEPMLKGELAACEYKKVPQLRFDPDDSNRAGPYLVDSRLIIDTLAPHLGFSEQLHDENVNQWRGWARGPLVRLVTLEFNNSLLAAWRGYSYIDDCTTIPYWNKLFLKVVGAPVMYMVAKRITKPRLISDGYLTPNDNPKTRLHEELNKFHQEVLSSKDNKFKADLKSKKIKKNKSKTSPEVEYAFHGGRTPDLVDLDVFGVLQSVRGHRVYNEIVNETNLTPWMNEMDKALGRNVYAAPSSSSVTATATATATAR